MESKTRVVGYAVAYPSNAKSSTLQIVSLYAATKGIAESLVYHMLHDSSYKGIHKVIFSTSIDQWAKVRSLCSYKSRPVYRRHTRAIPVNVKWEQIFALNVGMNLF